MTSSAENFELPFEIRWALTREAVKLEHAKVASQPKEVRRQVVLDTIRRCLGPQPKLAYRPNETKMLQAEIASYQLIGRHLADQQTKQAFLGKTIAGGIGKALMNPIGAGVASSVATMALPKLPGIIGQMSAGVNDLGKRIGNAYNAFTAVDTGPPVSQLNKPMVGGQAAPQSPALSSPPAAGGMTAARPEVGVPPSPGAQPGGMTAARPEVGVPPAPGLQAAAGGHPFDADFNNMTMAQFKAHQQALLQRLIAMSQAYPAYAVQQQQAQAQPYRPSGVVPAYYGL